MNIDLIVGLAGVLGSIVAVILSLRKAPHETNKLDAETLQTYINAAKVQQERYNQLDAKFETYKAEIEERMAGLEEENELLKDWAERLVHQVQSLGGVPVKIKTKKPITKE